MLQNTFFHPGLGIKLRRVNAATGNVAVLPEATTIPPGGYSESVAAHDCLELMFRFEFDAATDGDDTIDIESSPSGDFANSQVFETVGTTNSRMTNWNAGVPLAGFFRIRNNASSANLTVSVQKRIA